MATTTKKTTKTVNKTSSAKKVNTSLINASMAVINTTLVNGEKWQKLASKLIKKSEKVREQQINMIFDTAESVKGQFVSGTDKVKDLVGYDAELVKKAKGMAINHPVSKKVAGLVEDITEKVSENPMVQKAEKATEDFKNMGIAKFKELKGDVLEQASKIIDKGEAIIEDAKSTPKAKATKKVIAKKTLAKKATATKTVAKKSIATKTVAKKAIATKAKGTKVISKAAPKKTVAKKTTIAKAKETKAVTKVAPKAKVTVAKATTAKKETVAKTIEVNNAATAKVAEVQTEVTE
jgi:hypothetical protein